MLFVVPALPPSPPAQEQVYSISSRMQKRDIDPGIKSYQMFEELNQDILADYDKQMQILNHHGTSYKVLQGSNDQISQSPVVCMGSNPIGREIIALNPSSSPLLQSKYQELLSFLKQQNLSTQETLQTVSDFVREQIFNPEICTESFVDALIDRWENSSKRTTDDFSLTQEGLSVPVIHIDTFILNQIGICRHQAFVTAYLLDRIVKEEPDLLPSGKIYYVRDVVSIGRIVGGHAWNLYVPDDPSQCWHVDALWDMVKNVKAPQDLADLAQAYGPGAIGRELTRFIQLD